VITPLPKKKQPSKRKITVIAALVIVAGLVGWLATLYFLPGSSKPLIEDMNGQNRIDLPSQASDIKVPVTIFYPSGAGLVKEDRTVSAGSLPVRMVESVLQEYFAGFKNDMKNTLVRGVFRDRNRTFYIDLSDEFRRNFSGDARSEYYLLKSLYQTIVANIPEVRDVKIIIEGREVESLGGHMIIMNPLRDSVSN
jgi:hypothetical protein